MGLYQKIVGNAKKPAGFLGHMMLAGMNLGHTGLANWGCRFLGEEIPDQVLDIGCGGGVNVKRFLNRYADAHVTGLDYSAVSVESARKRNRAAIKAGRCGILQADVSNLNLPENQYDLETAFETVYFWPEIHQSFEHVLRVLKPGGRFLIVNESTGTDPAGVKFAKIIDGMNLYTPERLKELLEAVGFTDVKIHQAENKPWIAVVGRQPSSGIRYLRRSFPESACYSDTSRGE